MQDLRLLINASNLHSGGGVQVAVSLISELARMDELPRGLTVFASQEVHSNLKVLNVDCSRFEGYDVYDTRGISTLWSGLWRKARNFDAVFTVFGPLYLWPMGAVSIVGFAQPWIINPSNEIYHSLSRTDKVRTRLKFFLQSLFFKTADRLVVELEHVASSLLAQGFCAEKDIDVVHNCLNSVYFHCEQWKSVPSIPSKKSFSIGFVGRDYPHKNTNILPRIKVLLSESHGLEVDFFVTMNPAEWSLKSDRFRNNVVNVGSLDVAQCPSFYLQMDAVIFPSFLECFSATPLEALAMKRPLFASDRGFVRDVCGDFAHYFDPTCPISAANVIADYIKNTFGHDGPKLSAAHEYVLNFSNSRQRALEYLRIMQASAINRANA